MPLINALEAIEAQLLKTLWFEEYKCGCVSNVVSKKKDLPGYCPKHGSDMTHVFKQRYGCAVQVRPYGTATK